MTTQTWPARAARKSLNLLLGACALLSSAGISAAAEPASIDLPGNQVFPENIASTEDGTIYVGSLGAGGIYRIMPHSTQATVWIKPGAFGSLSIFGVLADEKSHTLWACSNDLSALGLKVPGSDAGNYLKGYDLSSGEGKMSVKLPGAHTLCNDITVGPDGAAYVTNSSAPQILRLPPGGKQFEVWAEDPMLAPPSGGGAGLDGLAFGADGNLYVDTYTAGELFRVTVTAGKAGKVTKLKPSQPMALTDAIRSLGGNSFLIIEGAGRLDRMTIDGDTATVQTLKDGYDVPTGVAIVGSTAWVSEGQLSAVFDAKKKNLVKLPFHIYSVGIPAR